MSKIEKNFNIVKTIAADVAPVAAAKIAAMITIKNKPISFGVCQYKTDPFQAKYGKNSDSICLHAEINSIKNALRKIHVDELKNCTMYIARIKNKRINNEHNLFEQITGLAKPCSGCNKAIIEFGIKRVYYTLDDTNEFGCY